MTNKRSNLSQLESKLRISKPSELDEEISSDEEAPLPPKPSISDSELSPHYWNILRIVKYIKLGSPTATLLALCSLTLHDLKSAYSQVALENSDALDVLVNVLEADDYKCKIASLRVLRDIVSNSERFRRSLVAKEGLPTLVSLLSEPQQEVRCLAAATLAHAVRESKSRNLACKAGAIPLLVDLLDVEVALHFSKANSGKNSGHPKLDAATAAANALWALSYSSTARRRLRLAGGVSLLIRTLQVSDNEREEKQPYKAKKRAKTGSTSHVHSTINCELLTAVTGVLQQCTEDESFRKSMQGEIILSELVRLLRVATHREQLQTHCASAISHFAQDDQNRKILLKLKTAEVLTHVMKQNDIGSRSSLLKAVAMAIWKFTFLPEAAERFRQLRVVDLLIPHLSEQKEEVVVPIVSTLSILAKDMDNVEAVRRGGAVPRLVWLLSGNNPDLLAPAALTVANLTAEQESLELLESLDAARLLWSLLKQPIPPVQAAAATAIAAFSQHSRSAGEVSRSLVGGLELLVSLLRAPEIEVVTAAAAAVARMAVEDETLAVLSDHHVVTLLASLVKTKNQQLQLYVAEAIAQCCRWPGNPQQFGLAGGVRPLIAYLKSKNLHLKRAAVKALYQVSFYPPNCAVLHGSQAVPILLKLVGCDDPSIQEAAAGCLANIRNFTRIK